MLTKLQCQEATLARAFQSLSRGRACFNFSSKSAVSAQYRSPRYGLSFSPQLLFRSLSRQIAFPPLRNSHLRDAIQRCLVFSPEGRISIPDLLRHPFLRPDLLPAAPSAGPGPAAPGIALSEQQLQVRRRNNRQSWGPFRARACVLWGVGHAWQDMKREKVIAALEQPANLKIGRGL
jgi:serine/threonine protein kinase